MSAHAALRAQLEQAALAEANSALQDVQIPQRARPSAPCTGAHAAARRGLVAGALNSRAMALPDVGSVNGLDRARANETVIQVYVSAGLTDDPDDDDYRSCNYQDDSRCSLWRVSVQLPSLTVVGVTRLIEARYGIGAVEASISPDGSTLAVVRRSESESWLQVAKIGRRGLTDWETADSGSHTNRPQFPAWRRDDTVLYHKGAEGSQTLYSVGVTGRAPISLGTPEAVLGPAALSGVDRSFQDPAVRASTTAPLTFQPELVTFGQSATSSDPHPLVSNLPSRPGAGIRTQRFELGQNLAGRSITECHHPAWNQTGDAVACTAHSPNEQYPSPGDPYFRMLYMYRKAEGAAWSLAGQPFIHPTDDDLYSMFGNMFPNDGHPDGRGRSCAVYQFKYAQWCGSNQYMVLNLFCTDGEGSVPKVLSSRVVLIRTWDGTMVDLTASVAQALGINSGDINGFTATCAP